jgi:hypothetical protein
VEDAAENQAEQPVAKRGEAAYKENLARIAERNAKVKKEGKQRREKYEQQKDDQRRVRELRERSELPGRRGR